jgi:hypothetical protein
MRVRRLRFTVPKLVLDAERFLWIDVIMYVRTLMAAMYM